MATMSDYRVFNDPVKMTDHVTEEMKKELGIPRCENRIKPPDGHNWVCTRPKGHTGRHEAGIDRKIALAEWDMN